MTALRYRWWVFDRVHHAWAMLCGREIPHSYYLPSVKSNGKVVIETRHGWLLVERDDVPHDQLTEQLVEAALRFTFRNTLRPQADADQKLAAICRVASKIQQQRHPDKRWDTGI